MRRAICVCVLAILAAARGDGSAAEIRVWTARALATVLAEVGGEFERASGHRLIVSSDLPAAFLRRFNDGESFDVLISGAIPVDDWIREGRIAANSRTEIARSGIGVEVRSGRQKPDISTVDAFTRVLLDARSIAYLNVGSGIYLEGLFERLGLARALAAKTIRPDTDIVSELVARGEVEIGMTVITQILTTPGVELVGPLPAEIQSYVTFVAGVSTQSKAAGAAAELVEFLRGPSATAVIKKQGMDVPVTARLAPQ
jgi:molybdate transport system substrate-binding protein